MLPSEQATAAKASRGPRSRWLGHAPTPAGTAGMQRLKSPRPCGPWRSPRRGPAASAGPTREKSALESVAVALDGFRTSQVALVRLTPSRLRNTVLP